MLHQTLTVKQKVRPNTLIAPLSGCFRSAPLQHPDNTELTGSQPNADYQVTSTAFQCPDNRRSTGNFAPIIAR